MTALPTAHVDLDAERVLGEISPWLFGGFAEHMGRCIYEGFCDPATGWLALFMVNRSQVDDLPVEVAFRGFEVTRFDTALQLTGDNAKAANSFAKPDPVVARPIPVPAIADGRVTIDLPPLSHTVLVSAGADR